MFAYCNNNSVNFADASGFSLHPCTVTIHDGGYKYDESEQAIRDVTEEVGDALIQAAIAARETCANAYLIGGDSVMAKGIIYLNFYSKVDHNAPWDIKRAEVWESTIRTPYPGYDVYVEFAGVRMTPEQLGNFTYGFLGYAYEIPLIHLIGGSYYAAGFPKEQSALSNEMFDWFFVSLGYEYAKGGTT